MKKITLCFTALLLTCTLVRAQQEQLANAGFEGWDTIGDYTQPKKWFTLNPLSAFGFDPTTTITTDAHSGAYAVVLESKANTQQDLPGILCTGPILSQTGAPDFDHTQIKFTSTPSRLRFWYKSFPMPNDTCVFSMVLTKWNPVTASNDTLADADFLGFDSVGVYTMADIPFTYYRSGVPDSAMVIVSSSIDGFSPEVGSKFILDDITLVYSPAGIPALAGSHKATVYPNPANNLVEVNLNGSTQAIATLYDEAGRKILGKQISEQQSQLDISDVLPGVYLLILEGQGNTVQHVKLVVQH